jgi:hypothetical protein
MSNKFIPLALAPDADVFAGATATDRIKVPGTGKLQFLVIKGVGATGTFTITVNSYAANSGGTGTALAFRYKNASGAAHEIDDASGFTTATTAGVLIAAGSSASTLVELRHDEVTEGEPYVELITTEGVDSPIDGAVVAIIKDGDRPGSGVTSL